MLQVNFFVLDFLLENYRFYFQAQAIYCFIGSAFGFGLFYKSYKEQTQFLFPQEDQQCFDGSIIYTLDLNESALWLIDWLLLLLLFDRLSNWKKVGFACLISVTLLSESIQCPLEWMVLLLYTKVILLFFLGNIFSLDLLLDGHLGVYARSNFTFFSPSFFLQCPLSIVSIRELIVVILLEVNLKSNISYRTVMMLLTIYSSLQADCETQLLRKFQLNHTLGMLY